MSELVNIERNKAGAKSLGFSDALNHAAAYHSWDQAIHTHMTHDDWRHRELADRLEDAGVTGWTSIGENVAFGYQSTEKCMTSWMNSPEHRANILNPAFTHFGTAVWFGPDGLPYFTQAFSGDKKSYKFDMKPRGLPSSAPTCQTTSQTPRSGPAERGSQSSSPQSSGAAAPSIKSSSRAPSVKYSNPAPSYKSSGPAPSSDPASHCKNRPANAPPNATLKVTTSTNGRVTTYHCKWNWMVKA
ncbi:CAP domain-containing protein [Piptocephalis cylindrospora]|uniref:CAP domain-containing protein n=1 Tax=Piptocephalis cylindrospora TaxID=1907219 RepID=A0A4P9XZ74_9FUNG|nr:CAP domain-containing protein [Piptocephalis cylindrospora]|eukprot:RKP11697.1 CAP domain-containing protein [Piptocephalis cylindrospora]